MSDDAYGDNVWEPELPEVWDGVNGRRLVREQGRPLSGAVWELPPGSAGVDYHFHHGTEEFLIVPGEKCATKPSASSRSPGPDGAHTVMNRSDEPMRYVMIGAHTSPDIVEYPDKGEFAAFAKSPSQRGQPFFVRQPLPED